MGTSKVYRICFSFTHNDTLYKTNTLLLWSELRGYLKKQEATSPNMPCPPQHFHWCAHSGRSLVNCAFILVIVTWYYYSLHFIMRDPIEGIMPHFEAGEKFVLEYLQKWLHIPFSPRRPKYISNFSISVTWVRIYEPLYLIVIL
jgi:hypothetical protein